MEPHDEIALNALETAAAQASPKARMRLLREMVGHTQQTLADELGVHPNSVKRWERPDWPDRLPPDDVLDHLEHLRIRQAEVVAEGVSRGIALAEGADGLGVASVVVLPIWRSQAAYDAVHAFTDPGPVGCANASVRMIAALLMARGVRVEAAYR